MLTEMSHRLTFAMALAILFLVLQNSVLGVSFEQEPVKQKSSTSNSGPIKKATVMEKKSDPKFLVKSQSSSLWKSLTSSALPSSPLTSSPTASLHRQESTFLESDLPVNVTLDDTFDEKNFTDQMNLDEEIMKSNPDFPKIANHSYYQTIFYKNPKEAMDLWVDIKSLGDTQFVHDVLSDSHRRAASISLPFQYPFYGNNLTKTTVATGGFLYMGEHVHSWLAATQYIAPLMANFDTRNSAISKILYGYNSSIFVIQWENVMLQENPELKFTFQCAIKPNGDIIFVYKNIPIPIEKIPDSSHPVKIGLSDAYFIHRQQIFVRRKTIYEYHKIDLLKEKYPIGSQTAFYLKALPTCYSFKTCDACLNSHLVFDCTWCESLQRCSDGYERARQDWISHHCEQENVHEIGKCAALKSTKTASMATTESVLNPPLKNASSSQVTPSPTIFHNVSNPDQQHHQEHSVEIDPSKGNGNKPNVEYSTQQAEQSKLLTSQKRQAAASAHSSWLIGLLFFVSIISGLSLWVLYAYHHPTSTSGQFLIRWRPSKWSWNGAETRYTAASIHM